MRYCIFCGIEIPPDAKFCQICGKEQPEYSTEAGGTDQADSQNDPPETFLDKILSNIKLLVIGVVVLAVLIVGGTIGIVLIFR